MSGAEWLLTAILVVQALGIAVQFYLLRIAVERARVLAIKVEETSGDLIQHLQTNIEVAMQAARASADAAARAKETASTVAVMGGSHEEDLATQREENAALRQEVQGISATGEDTNEKVTQVQGTVTEVRVAVIQAKDSAGAAERSAADSAHSSSMWHAEP